MMHTIPKVWPDGHLKVMGLSIQDAQSFEKARRVLPRCPGKNGEVGGAGAGGQRTWEVWSEGERPNVVRGEGEGGERE